MNKLLEKPATVGIWCHRSLALVAVSVISLLPLVFLANALAYLLGLGDQGFGPLYTLLALVLHLLLWWQAMLGLMLIIEALGHGKSMDAIGGLVWLALLVGFQLFCWGIARELQDPDAFSLNIH